MKTVPYCIPHILQMVLDTARQVSDDAFIHRKVLLRVMGSLVDESELGTDPVELTRSCIETAYKTLGVKDPFDKEKARRNKAMLGLEESFRNYLSVAPDSLSASLNLVLAGYASADLHVLGRSDVERVILENLSAPLAHDDRSVVLASLARAQKVLYLLGNAGEIVLDKLLIEELAKTRKVTAAVSAHPMLALATAADAEAVGLPEISTVIDPGAPMLGISLERASTAFREAFAEADLVIAKGVYHFSTLRHAKREIFFMLRAESDDIAQAFQVGTGACVMAQWNETITKIITEKVIAHK